MFSCMCQHAVRGCQGFVVRVATQQKAASKGLQCRIPEIRIMWQNRIEITHGDIP